MNTATIAGILRAIIAAFAGYAAGKGIDISGLNSPEFINGLLIVGTAVWSVASKKSAAKAAPQPPAPTL